MAHPLINGSFYNAILHFEDSEEAQEYYYKVMSSVVERNGKQYTVRDQILRVSCGTQGREHEGFNSCITWAQ